MVPWKAITGWHVTTTQCAKGGGGGEMAVGGRVYTGERVEGLSDIWEDSHDGHLFQIPGAGLDGGRLRLESGGREYS